MESEDNLGAERGRDFISQIVADEVAAGKNGGRVQTRSALLADGSPLCATSGRYGRDR